MKYKYTNTEEPYTTSPSMRREWIEIVVLWQNYVKEWVSLHAEGVD